MKREAFENPLKVGKDPCQGRGQMLPTGGEVSSCCPGNLKTHHRPGSSEFRGASS